MSLISKTLKHFNTDRILILLGISIASVALFFFFKDDGLGRVRFEKSPPIGSFKVSHNDVRRKTRGGFTWSATTQDDQIYEGDSIFTGESSDASIQLNNESGGGQIDIEQKSLVVLKAHGNRVHLDLQYGSLSGKINEKSRVVIVEGGKRQEISAQKAEIRLEKRSTSTKSSAHGKPERTSLRVVRGEIKVRKIELNESNSEISTKISSSDILKTEPEVALVTQVIKENQIARISSDSDLEIEQDKFEHLSPKSNEVLWSRPNSHVEFQWKPVSAQSANGTTHKESTQSKLEISLNSEFLNPIISETVENHNAQVQSERLPLGLLYWRAVPTGEFAKFDASSTHFRVSSFHHFRNTAPLLTFPIDNQEFFLETQNAEKSKQISLSWTDDSGSTDFNLQISRDEKFAEVIHSRILTNANEKTPPLPPGIYFWRVMGQHALRKNPPLSPVSKFSILEAPRMPAAPLLTANEVQYEIPIAKLEELLNRTSEKNLQVSSGVAAVGLPPFEWTHPEADLSYEVELASDNQFSNSMKISTGIKKQFALSEVKPGLNYVRIRAKAKSGLMSPPSELGRLTVSLPPPVLTTSASETKKFGSQSELEKGRHPFLLKWSKLPYAAKYEVNWGADPDFVKSKKFNLLETERSVVVTQEGNYYARVRALASDGEPLSPYSPTQKMNFKKTRLPTVLTRTTKQSQGDLSNLSATKMPGTRTAATIQPTLHPKADSAPKPVNPAAQPANSRMPLSVPKQQMPSFSVPALVEPLPNTTFVAMEGSIPFINLKWRYQPTRFMKKGSSKTHERNERNKNQLGVQNEVQYEIEFSEDADFTKVVERLKTRTNSLTVKTQLPEGRIFWRVRAKTSNQEHSEWSNVYDITVLYQ